MTVDNTIKPISPTTITKTTAATIITANMVTAFNATTVGVTGSVTATATLVARAETSYLFCACSTFIKLSTNVLYNAILHYLKRAN